MRQIRKFLLFAGLCFFLEGCSLTTQPTKSVGQQLMSLPTHSFVTVTLKGQPLKFEVVNTAASTEQGLSGRSEIGSDGLLFTFPQLDYQRFWMKDMKFALDFVWLNDLKVVDITPNVPFPLHSGDALPVYAPKAPVNQVLEVPAGQVARWQLQLGDTFSLSQ